MNTIIKRLTEIIRVSALVRCKTVSFQKVLLIAMLFNTQILPASIESISTESLSQSGNQSYWQVEVNCSGESSGIIIRQQGGQSSWCTNNGTLETCEDSKEGLADKICNTALLSLLRSSERQPAPAVEQTLEVQPAPKVQPLRVTDQKAVLEKQRREREQQQATIVREVEANRLIRAQLKLRQERNSLNTEKAELQNIESNLKQQLAEIEEQIKQLN